MFKFVYSKSWISKVFLAVLAFSFILGTAIMWGPGGLNFGFGNYVIKVEDITVTPKEFILELGRLQRSYGEKISRDKLKAEALNNLLITAIFAYLAEKNGFYVSNEEVKDFIVRQFSDKNGKFNEKEFQRYLQYLKLTPKEFEKIVKTTLLANKYKSAVFSTTYVNRETLNAYLFPFTLKIKAQILELNYKQFTSKVKFDEEELREFYKKIQNNFAIEEPPKVEIFKVASEGEVKELYNSLTKGKNLKLKPFKVFPISKGEKYGEFKKLVEKVLKNKKVAVEKSKDGYLIAVYREGERRIPSFEEVKEQVKLLYEKFKTLEWMEKHKEKLAKEVLDGKYKAQAKELETIGFTLMQNFGIPVQTLLEVLKGKRYIAVKTGEGLAVIKILSVGEEGNISAEVKDYYRLLVRNSQYLRKLQEVLQEVYRNGGIEVKINNRLVESL
ncbi:MAG: hypothetical protein DSZ31_00945 [Gammaproteobacteria bacterium]|nr:MAG: hypothetical protein DSZ31_00945 [Gammaproteobacteria bacterium]RTZ69165.1 MAG: hypothetical protein DSZ30_03030 [Aquificaceae bacterium]